MKQLKLWVRLVMTMFTVSAVFACSSDDNDETLDLSTMTQEQITASIVGNWYYTEDGGEDGETWSNKGTWAFNADGTFNGQEDGRNKTWEDYRYWQILKIEGKWFLIISYNSNNDWDNYESKKCEIQDLSSQSLLLLYQISGGGGSSRYTAKRK